MQLDHQSCYRALVSRDSRFDGQFFVGVSTTGVYCRPICRVRQPKSQNVRFFKSAAAAEKNGFRPCLRCRPELAPGYSTQDSKSVLAVQAKKLLDLNQATPKTIQSIATMLGITDRYLRQIFQEKYGVRPIEYLQSKRLLTAKHLLTDSHLNIADIAFTSGFNSVRRLNASFKDQYGLTPTAVRRSKAKQSTDEFTFKLGFRPPYATQHLLAFLATRQLKGMEQVLSNKYYRTLTMPHPQQPGKRIEGWLSVKFAEKENYLSVHMAEQLLPCFAQLQQQIIRAFDLSNTPEKVSTALKNQLMNGLNWIEGLRIPGCVDFFEVGVRAILGQQIGIQAAVNITQRFLSAFGNEISTPHMFLCQRFPTPEEINELVIEDIASLGIFRQRAKAIQAFANFCCQHPDFTELSVKPGNTVNALTSLPGIGPWTANYIALRGLGWPAAALPVDSVVKAALKEFFNKNITSKETNVLIQQWQPWAGYMCLNLWNWHASAKSGAGSTFNEN